MKLTFFLLTIFLSLIILISINGVWGVGDIINTDDPNLILYHQFNNDSSFNENYGVTLIVNDSKGINGTSSGSPVYNSTGGFLGDGAFEFDGTNDYINLGNYQIYNSPNVTQRLTICAWSRKYNHITTDDDGGISYRASSYGLFNYKNRTLYGFFMGGARTTLQMIDYTELGKWYYFCGTYNGTTHINFLNGVPILSTTKTVLDNVTSSTFYIGLESNGGQTYLNGSVDEVTLWNRTLSLGELKSIYNKYVGTECLYNNVFDNCTVNYNLQLNSSQYFHINATYNAINISSSNVHLDCNGSYIIGNGSSNYGIRISNGLSNITISNCNILGYKYGIFSQSSQKINLINNNITSSDYSGVFLKYSTLVNISFNKFYGSVQSFIGDSNFSEDSYLNVSSLDINYTQNDAISLEGVSDSFIIGNSVDGISGSSLYLYGNSMNNTFYDNVGINVKNGIALINGLNNYFFNTTILNSTVFARIANQTNNLIDGFRFVSFYGNRSYPFFIQFVNTSETGYLGYYSNGLTVSNGTAYNNHTLKYGYYINDIYNSNHNFLIKNVITLSDWGEYKMYYGNNITIINSTFWLRYWVDFWHVKNVKFYNCTFINSDQLFFLNVSNLILHNNKLINFTSGRDHYYLGLSLKNVNNFTVSNNTLTNIGQNCYLIIGSSNGTFKDNYCDTVNLSEGMGYPFNLTRQWDYPIVGFYFSQSYKGWVGSGTQPSNINRGFSIFNTSQNVNINLINNTFGNNVQVLSREHGINIGINYSNEINNTWYVSWQIPLIYNRDHFYISNDFQNLSHLRSPYGSVTPYLSYLQGEGSYWTWYDDIYYTFDKNYLRFYLPSATQYMGLGNITNLYNLTNSFIYYKQNNTIYRTSSLNEQLNYSLVPNGELYVYTDYHLTEDRPLPGEPINISSSVEKRTSKRYHLTNNATYPTVVENLSTNLSVDCSNVSKVIITPNGLDSYEGVYTCTDDRLYLQNLNLTFSLDSNVIVVVYNTTEDFISYQNNSYETKNETFILNLSYDSDSHDLIHSYLIYNNTWYTPDQSGSGDNLSLSKTIDIPLVSKLTNHSWYWHLLLWDGLTYIDYNTTLKNLSVDNINMSLCDYSVFNQTYITYTFKDETNSTNLQAAFDAANFDFYLGSGTVKKTYNFVNTTINSNYTFCILPEHITLNIDPSISYSNSPDYDTRTYNPTAKYYDNVTDTEILYLQLVGQAVIYQIVNQVGQVVDGVSVSCSRLIGATWTEVASGTTDSSGSVTFFLNPYIQHQCTFSKTDYSGYTWTGYPTQPSTNPYVIQLTKDTSTSGSTFRDYTKTVTYRITPSLSYLYNKTTYNFSFTISSTGYDIDSFGFTLGNGTTIYSAKNATTDGGCVSVLLSTGLNNTMIMNYYYIIDNNRTNISKTWIILAVTNQNYSIFQFANDLKHYLSNESGIFGLNNVTTAGKFSVALISFLIIFISVGIISYKFGVDSGAAIASFIFGIILFLDVFIGIIPQVYNLPVATIITGIICFAMIFKEVQT